jgi:hypothetical protein
MASNCKWLSPRVAGEDRDPVPRPRSRRGPAVSCPAPYIAELTHVSTNCCCSSAVMGKVDDSPRKAASSSPEAKHCTGVLSPMLSDPTRQCRTAVGARPGRGRTSSARPRSRYRRATGVDEQGAQAVGRFRRGVLYHRQCDARSPRFRVVERHGSGRAHESGKGRRAALRTITPVEHRDLGPEGVERAAAGTAAAAPDDDRYRQPRRRAPIPTRAAPDRQHSAIVSGVRRFFTGPAVLQSPVHTAG